jgi:signal transduction histidine kinase
VRRFRSRLLWHLGLMALLVTAVVVAVARFGGHIPGPRQPLVVLLAVAVMLGARNAARRLARPIEMLTEATRRFGAGELSYRVAEPPPWLRRRVRLRRARHRGGRPLDEVVELGRSWNEMAERIERLVRGQKELLASVSHDLRSPLARVRVALELLPRGEGAAAAEAEARLADIERDLAELDRMIDDVLTTSRLDGAPAPARVERVSIPGLLDELVARAANDPVVGGKELRIACAFRGEVDGDPALLRRALWNLVENAAKHGVPPITVSAAAAEGPAPALVVTVHDEGGGIPAADRERVFEPFVRGDPARTPGTGVGLGLTIARRVAEAHGGELRLEDPPHGCSFALYIPFTPAT